MDMKDLTVPHGNSSTMKQKGEIIEMKSVHEVCVQYSISRKTLFYYDQIGLLKPTRRVGTQKTKMYGRKALEQLEMIIAYQTAGLTLKEIQKALEAGNREKIELLKNSIRRMKEEKKLLQEKLNNATQLMKQLEDSLK